MKNTYLILMVTAVSFWNKSANAQAYACCADNSTTSSCVVGDSQHCCTNPSNPYPYCGGSSATTGDFEIDPNSCNSRYDIDRLCQKSAPPKEVTPQKGP